jgi:hypothetical protein
LLKETAKQIFPALTQVFQASINQANVSEEWKSANITPLFKQGDISAPVWVAFSEYTAANVRQ